MTLINHILQALETNKLSTVSENNREISFARLGEIAQDLSVQILRLTKSGTKCIILCRSELNSAIALVACFAANVVAIPLSFKYGNLHNHKIVNLIDPDLIISDETGNLDIKLLNNKLIPNPELSDIALFMCTSGTTGLPKCAMLTKSGLIQNAMDICDYFDENPNNKILITRPLCHASVLTGEFIVSILKGINIHFDVSNFSPKSILKLIEKNNITIIGGTPTRLYYLCQMERNKELAKINAVIVSGECMTQSVAQSLIESFTNGRIYHGFHFVPQLLMHHSYQVGAP